MEANDEKNADITRTRAISLFTYLRELTQLRTKVTRLVDDYEKVLWFQDLPKEAECYTPAWGASQEGLEDVWLEIRKPALRPYPAPPNELRPWIRMEGLAESSEIPSLLPRILATIEHEGTETSSSIENPQEQPIPQYIELSNNPHITPIWEKYLEEKWLPWAVENERLKKVQKAYAELHTMYQQQKKSGEAFEVIVGIGLLNWETPKGLTVRRHLLTAQGTIELEGRRGTLTVTPSAEGARLALEQDMLEGSERPIPEKQNVVEEQLKQIGDEIWNNELLKEALRNWIHAVSPTGTYTDEQGYPKEVSDNPKVTYSPALILRKRTERNLLRAFKDIIDKLQGGIPIPLGVQRTVEIIDEKTYLEQLNTAPPYEDDDEFYLPLETNEEQNKIIETLRHRQGILVQGPPGTGKSHTIANIICGLLAKGKRVLVTSQTPRALKVLKDKIPDEIKALCVSLLGNDREALKGLETSVHGITNRFFNWNADQNEKNINHLKIELQSYRETEAGYYRQLRELRERETYIHRICDGHYTGTAQVIAQRISSERTKSGWLDETIEIDTPPSLTNEEAQELLRLEREFRGEREEEAKGLYI